MKRSLEKRIVDWEVYLKNLNVDLLKANIIGERDGWLRSLRVVEEFVWMCGFIEHIWKASWRNGLLIEKYIEEFELVDLFNAYEKILGETDWRSLLKNLNVDYVEGMRKDSWWNRLRCWRI